MSALMTSTFGVAAPLRAAPRRSTRARCAAAPVRAVGGPAVPPTSEAVRIANSVGLTGLEVRNAQRPRRIWRARFSGRQSRCAVPQRAAWPLDARSESLNRGSWVSCVRALVKVGEKRCRSRAAVARN
jgi:hypothetical protein